MQIRKDFYKSPKGVAASNEVGFTYEDEFWDKDYNRFSKKLL